MVCALCRDCLWRGQDVRRCTRCASPRLIAHPELFSLSIAHLDCDAFYASVEKRDRPELRDAPVIVGGGARGVVTTCCYVARLSGVRSAMPMFQARRLCPEAVVIAPDFAKYRGESRRVLALMRDLTPLVQPLSLDEAWLDLSGTERLHGAPPAVILATLQARIEREIGIGVSIGLAPNKFLAKVASDLDKPRGFQVIGRAEAAAALAPLPVRVLPGVGPALERRLAAADLARVGDIADAGEVELHRRLGPQGIQLLRLAKGEDERPVEPDLERKSVSAETTFEEDLSRIEDLEDVLWTLAEKVGRRARADGLAGRVVALKLRAADFRIVTRSRTLELPCRTARTLFAEARAMLRCEPPGVWRLIGVGLSCLSDAA
ncbi:MAG: DNA polymerase IV, partial [Candidatus Dormibacteria bacterium]